VSFPSEEHFNVLISAKYCSEVSLKERYFVIGEVVKDRYHCALLDVIPFISNRLDCGNVMFRYFDNDRVVLTQ